MRTRCKNDTGAHSYTVPEAIIILQFRSRRRRRRRLVQSYRRVGGERHAHYAIVVCLRTASLIFSTMSISVFRDVFNASFSLSSD